MTGPPDASAAAVSAAAAPLALGVPEAPGLGLGALAGLLVLFVAVVALGVVVHRPIKAAADGRLGPEDGGGIRTSATLRSPEAWQLGHQAAMIYVRAMPVIMVLAVLGGIAGTLWGGAMVGFAVGLVGLAIEVFIIAMARIFAHIAAR